MKFLRVQMVNCLRNMSRSGEDSYESLFERQELICINYNVVISHARDGELRRHLS